VRTGHPPCAPFPQCSLRHVHAHTGPHAHSHTHHTRAVLVPISGPALLHPGSLPAADVVTLCRERRYTVLHWAAWHSHLPTVVRFLGRGGDPDARDISGRTPLKWAANNGECPWLFLHGCGRVCSFLRGARPLWGGVDPCCLSRRCSINPPHEPRLAVAACAQEVWWWWGGGVEGVVGRGLECVCEGGGADVEWSPIACTSRPCCCARPPLPCPLPPSPSPVVCRHPARARCPCEGWR
jgi:hypothetical protein